MTISNEILSEITVHMKYAKYSPELQRRDEVMSTGDPNEVVPLKPPLGHIVFYPPWMPARILPVTSGTRRSLNVWVMGKRNC